MLSSIASVAHHYIVFLCNDSVILIQDNPNNTFFDIKASFRRNHLSSMFIVVILTIDYSLISHPLPLAVIVMYIQFIILIYQRIHHFTRYIIAKFYSDCLCDYTIDNHNIQFFTQINLIRLI